MMNLGTPNYPTMSEDSLNWSDLDATGLRFAIVVARFNSRITEQLLESAKKALLRAEVEIFQVPGAFELPLAAKMLAQTHR
jgi:6,7-dimethyl-8-ribityllumazine synthase